MRRLSIIHPNHPDNERTERYHAFYNHIIDRAQQVITTSDDHQEIRRTLHELFDRDADGGNMMVSVGDPPVDEPLESGSLSWLAYLSRVRIWLNPAAHVSDIVGDEYNAGHRERAKHLAVDLVTVVLDRDMKNQLVMAEREVVDALETLAAMLVFVDHSMQGYYVFGAAVALRERSDYDTISIAYESLQDLIPQLGNDMSASALDWYRRGRDADPHDAVRAVFEGEL